MKGHRRSWSPPAAISAEKISGGRPVLAAILAYDVDSWHPQPLAWKNCRSGAQQSQLRAPWSDKHISSLRRLITCSASNVGRASNKHVLRQMLKEDALLRDVAANNTLSANGWSTKNCFELLQNKFSVENSVKTCTGAGSGSQNQRKADCSAAKLPGLTGPSSLR